MAFSSNYRAWRTAAKATLLNTSFSNSAEETSSMAAFSAPRALAGNKLPANGAPKTKSSFFENLLLSMSV
ncbi:hypothetical protein [Adhaeribacter soli]|uniref:Uncharacterized protein n=1 Tax=Adhaeribacter soli TaxID=2607655 RepID=A0A5N1INJ6_9BACT|nr:hypothetical protein [Adhaeribacter soli]KAA9325477.1 hypothetical protein F0P94_18005 [Adhaeribacter soli]